MFQLHPYFIPVMVSALITGYISLFAFERRKIRGATIFSLIMLLLFWWSFFYALELCTTDFALQKLFLRIQYFAIPFIPVAILYLVLEYGGYYKFLNIRVFGLLLILPIVSLVLLLTNDYHHLFFVKEYIVTANGILIRGFYEGPVYYIYSLYNATLYFVCAAILVHVHLSSQGIQKIQSAILMAALFAPFFIGVLYYLGITPYPYLDFTTIVIPISGICVMIGLFRYRFFDIVPLSRQTLFSSLSEGIIVLDEKKRIVDINQAAQSILGDGIEADGEPLFGKDTFLNKYAERFDSNKNFAFLTKVLKEDGEKYYAISITPVPSRGEEPLYMIIVIRDITSEKRYETELEKSKSSLRTANEKISLLNSITRHDILNNITILSGYTAILEEEMPEEGEAKEYLERINTAVEEITNQIRFTADYQNMGIEDPVWQELEPVISDAWNSLGLMRSDISLNIEIPEMEVYADLLFSKVFYNLFENSIRHGETVTKISVTFETKPDGTGVIIIKDDGVGVPEDIKGQIFSKGFGKNTGLGLFLVSEILAITRIKIFETGTEGEGARFEMLIHRNGWRMKKGE